MSRARELEQEGMATLEAAAAERRVDHARSEARFARRKVALELERAGRHDEAETMIAEVKAEQEEEGIA